MLSARMRKSVKTVTENTSFDFLRRVLTKCRINMCILPDDRAVADMGLRDMLGQGLDGVFGREPDGLRERTLYSFCDGFG